MSHLLSHGLDYARQKWNRGGKGLPYNICDGNLLFGMRYKTLIGNAIWYLSFFFLLSHSTGKQGMRYKTLISDNIDDTTMYRDISDSIGQYL